MDPYQPYHGDTYLEYDEVVTWCERAARALPHLITCERYGASREGRPLLLLTLAAGGGDPRCRPAFWFDGGTHASEWAGVMSTLFSVSRWLEGLEQGDPALTAWFARHTVYVAPCLSPDGYHHMRRGGAYL